MPQLSKVLQHLPRHFLLVALCLAVAAPAAAQQQQRRPQQQQQRSQPAPPPPPAPTTLPNGFPWIETEAQYAFIIDAVTGAVLLDKRADERMFPSSMTKMMTAHLVFEKLQKGELKMEDMLPVSEKAWRMGGSKMFVDIGSRVRIDDLLRGVVIQSGNDACIVLAEGLAGSEEAFAEEMTRKAKALGMTNTSFKNSSGWPENDHYSSSRDLAILAKHTIEAFPQYYKMYAEREFTYNGIKQANRNPLLYRNSGSDGLKTGHTEQAGYGLTASAVRDNRRIILVVNGLSSMQKRSQETERLTEWAFREFENYVLFKGGEAVERADVWLGSERTVALVSERPLVVTLPRKSRREMKVTVQYDSPVEAPVQKGARLGRLIVSAPSVDTVELPLTAAVDVERLGAFGRMGAAVSYLLFGNGK